MSLDESKKLGFVGVGRMGSPMATRLIDAGFTLTIYDTNEQAIAALVEKGAVRVDSPKAVADKSEVVLMSLPTPDIIKAVALGPHGLIEGSSVRTVIDLSTTGPRVAAEVADGLANKSITTIDCPVSGGVAGATKGTLAMMASGDKTHYEMVLPALNVLGKLFYVGDKPGMAQTMKVINNLISATSLAITSETMVMGAKAGLDADAMIEVINAGSGRTSASIDKIPNFVLNRGFNFGMTMGLSAKDMRLCIEEAEQLGVPMQVGNAVRDFLNFAKDKLGDQADMTEIIRVVEEAAGIEVHGKASKNPRHNSA